MGAGKSQYIGAAGQYFVAYGLSLRGANAWLTVGNAAGVDIMVSPDGGLSTLSIQVKTSRNAHRRNRYGSEGYEWDVGASVIGKQSPSFWFAFVNLQESETGWEPEVYFVPSKWVAEFVKPNWARFLYFLPGIGADLCRNKWELIPKFLSGDTSVANMASSWPEDKLVRWGVVGNQPI